MQTVPLTMVRAEARALYREYKKHQHYAAPLDWEIQRTYQLIAQGRLVIRALDSIRAAGANDQGLPKLAIMRADLARCHLQVWGSGEFTFSGDRWNHGGAALNFAFGAGMLPRRDGFLHAEGMIPTVPLHLRPKRGLQNYHTLWEAEWRSVVPQDPMLLRRIGKSDAWLVVAHWDLTPVERAVLETRLSA